MVSFLSGVDAAERLWLTTISEHWRSVEELADQVHLSTRDVEDLLNFLVRYGFVEAKLGPTMKVRANPLAPSPTAIAQALSSLP